MGGIIWAISYKFNWKQSPLWPRATDQLLI